jgi:hypothetical protein
MVNIGYVPIAKSIGAGYEILCNHLITSLPIRPSSGNYSSLIFEACCRRALHKGDIPLGPFGVINMK